MVTDTDLMALPVSPQAANPGCALEDFVRWYSPRDYVVEGGVDETGSRVVKGELSPRMKIPGNMWVEAWETARVTPARRQRRLFDDTKEAEKVDASSWTTPTGLLRGGIGVYMYDTNWALPPGSPLSSSAETCRPDPQPPALHPARCYPQAEGGR